MTDVWLNRIAQAMAGDFWLAPLLALLAGVLTSFTPCSLSGVPLVIGYVGGSGSRDPKRAFGYSVIFAAGTAVTFLTLGLIASSAGRLMGNSSPVWYGFLGVLMVLMALQTWGMIRLIPSANLLSKSRRRGRLGALAAGILAGIFASPCSTPVLIALLGMIAGKGSLLWGMLLMLLYSLGHSAPVIAAGTSVGFVRKVSGSGCKSCHALLVNINAALRAMAVPFEAEYVTDMAAVASYGVMSTPALVVNEKVVSMGKVYSAAEVEKLLHKLGY